jgi:hypothetical protein
MQFDAGLVGDAAQLAREHKDLLDRLPATIHAFILVELRKWPTLFAPEQRYQEALLDHLSRFSKADLAQETSGVLRVEADAGLRKISGDPARFQDEAQALLRKRQLLAAWRKEIDGFFQRIDPAIEAKLYPADAPRRLIVQVYSSGIAVQPGKLWSRFKGTGLRVALNLQGAEKSDIFLREVFGDRANDATAPAFHAAAQKFAGLSEIDTWIVESHDALHQLWARGDLRNVTSVTGLSYDRLRPYRDELTRALYSKIQAGVESPQAFAAYARSLQITPAPGVLTYSRPVLQTFVRDVLLTGNGTLFVNNTFVEWASVQALRRAQPRILVTRFGVRDKLKPFSSLLLFSQPRASDQIPLIEDPVGSFVDVEQLTYYVWLNAEKSPAYRKKTLYVFLAEGVDEMLAIRSDAPAASPTPLSPVTLKDVGATMARWLGLPPEAVPGRPIEVLAG